MSCWYKIDNELDVASPALLLYPDRIRENLRRMIALVGDVAKLRPHVKTHKLPQIIEMKLAHGISKFKTSTIAEAEMTASSGGKDVLLAYPLVGPNIRRFVALIQRFPATSFAALVDDQQVLYGIPNHICPTVALYNEVWCVANGQAIEKWPVVARSRCLTL